MPDDVNVAQSNPRNWANVQTPPGVPRTSLGRYARSVRHQLQSACAFESGICPVRRPPDQAACPRKDSNGGWNPSRSEEHTSELQSLMRISYAVFCLKKRRDDCRISATRTSPSQQTDEIQSL